MSKTFPFAFIRKKIIKTEKASISIQCKAVQYGLGFYSGMRGHWDKKSKNLYLFRPRDHFQRMKESASILQMKFPYTYPKWEKIIIDLIKKNKIKEDLYIRLTVYAASTKLTPRFDNPDDDLAIYMTSLKDYFNANKGLDVGISSWRRFTDDSISTKAKITGAYASSALAKTEALQNGYHEAIFLNKDGNICEASGANIFGIKDGIAYTPPLSDSILNGITRRTVIELLQNELDMEVREQSIDRSTIYTFDELFFTGTAAKVTWIASVDRRQIGSGKEGKTVKKLRSIFESITHNELPNYEDWLTSVY